MEFVCFNHYFNVKCRPIFQHTRSLGDTVLKRFGNIELIIIPTLRERKVENLPVNDNGMWQYFVTRTFICHFNRR